MPLTFRQAICNEIYGETRFADACKSIRRIGYERWLRNIAVALGNAPSTPENLAALTALIGETQGLGEFARFAQFRRVDLIRP